VCLIPGVLTFACWLVARLRRAWNLVCYAGKCASRIFLHNKLKKRALVALASVCAGSMAPSQSYWRAMKRKGTDLPALVGTGYISEELKAYYNCYVAYKQKVGGYL
jgi:hypothetical protein